ncbi:prepilin-type N-terminal cleavage/methylation domain-containing protein [Candidatus Parcubacteria bacterium]|nr:prepilin-type N-terminal cleavage/methylation domain-containing protein [Candidatus Parcubacteria bacterium]
MQKKAFTLIELLVVIAIIGILAGIVLVSLIGARNHARIIAAMSQIKTYSQSYESENGNYANFCSDTNVQKLLTDITNQGGQSLSCYSDDTDGTGFCAKVQLNSQKYYCVDSDLNELKGDSDFPCASGHYSCQP